MKNTKLNQAKFYLILLSVLIISNASNAQLFELKLADTSTYSKEKDLSILKDDYSDGDYFIGSTFYHSTTEKARIKKIDQSGNILWSYNYFDSLNSRFFSFVQFIHNEEVQLLSSLYTVQQNQKILTLVWIDANSGAVIKSREYGNFSAYNVYGLNIDKVPNQENIIVTGLLSPSNSLSINSRKRSFAMMIDMDGNIVWAKSYDSGVLPDSSNCNVDYDAMNHIVFGQGNEMYLIGNSNYAVSDTDTVYCNYLKAQIIKLDFNDGSAIWRVKHSLNGDSAWTVGVRGISRNDGLVVLENNNQVNTFSLLEFDNAGSIVNANAYYFGVEYGYSHTYGYNIEEDEQYYYVTGLLTSQNDSTSPDTGSYFIYKIDKSNYSSQGVTLFPLDGSYYASVNTGDYLKDYIKQFPIAYYPENSDLLSAYIRGITGADSLKAFNFIMNDDINLSTICTNVTLDYTDSAINIDVYDGVNVYNEDVHVEELEINRKRVTYLDTMCVNEDAWGKALKIESDLTTNNEVFIYPNPANEHIVISGENINTITIQDIQGRTIQYTVNTGTGKSLINTSDWSNGVYILKVSINGKNKQYKFVVIH